MDTTINIFLLVATVAISCGTVFSGIAAYRMVAVSKRQAEISETQTKISAEQATVIKHQRDINLAQILTSRLATRVSTLSINYQLIATYKQLEQTKKINDIDYSEEGDMINELNDCNNEVRSDMRSLEELIDQLYPGLEKLVSEVVADNKNVS